MSRKGGKQSRSTTLLFRRDKSYFDHIICQANTYLVPHPTWNAIIAISQREEQLVATLIVRNLDDGVKERLKLRAVKNGRSTEAEIRDILKAATRERTWISEWLERSSDFRGTAIAVPKRSAPRNLDLFSDKLL